MALDPTISAAWREASERLSIRVVAPFRVVLPDGDEVEVEAFLPDFGGAQGVVVVTMDDDARGSRAASGPHYVSRLAAGYRQYEDTLFRETLDDWGWFGAETDVPGWYTGRRWS